MPRAIGYMSDARDTQNFNNYSLKINFQKLKVNLRFYFDHPH